MNTNHEWSTYCEHELNLLKPILATHGYTLNGVQPHIAGERFLMQAVTTTSGRKLILYGANEHGTPVVIKATRDEAGARELAHEEHSQSVLNTIDFARDIFHTPEQLRHFKEKGFAVVITRFIPQESTFLERSTEEQFDFALRAFSGQEGAHATTFKHRALIRDTFGIRDSGTYLKNFKEFQTNIERVLKGDEFTHTLLKSAYHELETHKEVIEQYCGFLTHTDFVPHNIRIHKGTLYFLDHSSLVFGNKYEGWARFLNFMTLYNPPLTDALTQYVKDNRTPEESVSLRLMRIYRLGEIIWYYAKSLGHCSGNLKVLNTERVHFWGVILSHILHNTPIPGHVIETYKEKRDALRSADEKERQKGLH